MGLTDSFEQLRRYWESQNIVVPRGCSDQEIQTFEKEMALTLHSDFRQFYRYANGLLPLYPNDTDENGFLFYPLSGIEHRVRREFDLQQKPTVVFVDYMQRSWAYYVTFIDQDNYEIGITPSKSVFTSITNSLANFINYYIADNEALYKY